MNVNREFQCDGGTKIAPYMSKPDSDKYTGGIMRLLDEVFVEGFKQGYLNATAANTEIQRIRCKRTRWALTIYDTREDYEAETVSVRATFDRQQDVADYLKGYGNYFEADVKPFESDM